MNQHQNLNSRLMPFVCLAIVAWAAPMAFAADTDRGPATPPNVVLILSDDQAWNDYSFMGHEAIKTPRIDKLAAESATFTRGYVPDSLCRPSLATLITGLYAHQHGIVGNDPVIKPIKGTPKYNTPEYLELNQRLIKHIEKVPTLPRLLADKGYLSMQSGKWWEGDYTRGGFTHGMTHGDPMRGGRHGDAGLKIGREGMKPVFDFIDEATKAQKPYFVWYAPFLPHSPHNPPQRLLDKYTAEGKSIHVARYQAMCEWFDETCGELLDYVDKKEQRDNTIVIYVCDNGWIQDEQSPRYAPRSKRSQYDGGLRTPIMVRWPGHVESARFENTLISSVDIAPTILAAVGIKAPARMPGLNLLDVAAHEGKTDREAIFGEVLAHDIVDVDVPHASLLYQWGIEATNAEGKSWKLILSADNSPPELYELIADPMEQHNLADKHPDIVSRLTKKIVTWRSETK